MSTREFLNPVRFADTRNRTPKSLEHAGDFSRILQNIGETIGSPQTFAHMRQFIDGMAANPQLTVIDGWYTNAELDDLSLPYGQRKYGTTLRPVLLAPFSAEAADQPVTALCIRFDDTSGEAGLDVIGKRDNSTVDASVATIGGKPMEGTTVMELSLVTAQKEGNSLEQPEMRIIQDENEPRLAIKYNNRTGSEYAWLEVVQNGQEIPLQLSPDDAKVIMNVGQYFRRVLDRDRSDRVFTQRRQPRLGSGENEEGK